MTKADLLLSKSPHAAGIEDNEKLKMFTNLLYSLGTVAAGSESLEPYKQIFPALAHYIHGINVCINSNLQKAILELSKKGLDKLEVTESLSIISQQISQSVIESYTSSVTTNIVATNSNSDDIAAKFNSIIYSEWLQQKADVLASYKTNKNTKEAIKGFCKKYKITQQQLITLSLENFIKYNN